jgi:hypothetical protein
MTDLKPMPRAAILSAGWIIALAATAGFGVGLVRDLKGAGGAGGDADLGAAVAPIKAANAQPLVAPPVTEADVRRWAREELIASANARAAKQKADDDATLDPGDTAEPPPPPIVPGQPLTGAVTTPKPAPAQPTPQIPF